MIQVRAATLDDIPALARLAREQAEYQARLDCALHVEQAADWHSYIAARLRRTNAAILVAERSGEIAGFIDIRIAQQGVPPRRRGLRAAARRLLDRASKTQPSVLGYRRYGFIEDVYVAPSSRRTGAGVALKLHESAEKWFEQRQVMQMEGTVATSNAEVLELVRKLGYQPVRVLIRKEL